MTFHIINPFLYIEAICLTSRYSLASFDRCYRLGDGRVVCLTETVKGSIQIDPGNLETIGRFNYEDKLGVRMVNLHQCRCEITHCQGRRPLHGTLLLNL